MSSTKNYFGGLIKETSNFQATIAHIINSYLFIFYKKKQITRLRLLYFCALLKNSTLPI